MDTDWFRKRLRKQGKTQDDLARAIGRDRSVASRILNGDVGMQFEHVRAFAETLAVTDAEILHRCGVLDRRTAEIVQHLLGAAELEPAPEPLVYVPLISWVEAGTLREVVNPFEPGSAERWIAVTSRRETMIALRVVGRSMNLVAPEGSVIIVDYGDRELHAGACYVIRNDDGEATFKRYRSSPDRFEPVSTEEHETIFPGGQWWVIGRAVRVITDL